MSPPDDLSSSQSPTTTTPRMAPPPVLTADTPTSPHRPARPHSPSPPPTTSPASAPAAAPPPRSSARRASVPSVVDGLPPVDSQSLIDTPADDIIEMDTLNQILDLDEDDSHEFSRDMAWAYFSQAEETFQQMDVAYAAKNLAKLSSLGHFLKGSSAALGVTRVQASCEQVQYYGDLRDIQAKRDLSPDEALEKIGRTLSRVKVEYAAAERWLKDYYASLSSTA